MRSFWLESEFDLPVLQPDSEVAEELVCVLVPSVLCQLVSSAMAISEGSLVTSGSVADNVSGAGDASCCMAAVSNVMRSAVSIGRAVDVDDGAGVGGDSGIGSSR